MNIEYRNFRSQSQQQEVDVLVQKYKGIIPSWVQTFIVNNWDSPTDDKCTLASMETTPKYLLCNLHIYNMFFSNTDLMKEQTIVHEILHAHVGKIRSLVHGDMIDYIREQNEDLAIFMQRQYSELEEQFVEQFSLFLVEQRRGS